MNSEEENIILKETLAKLMSKLDTIKCYMCHGGKYFEWVEWETFDDEHKEKYRNKVKELLKESR